MLALIVMSYFFVDAELASFFYMFLNKYIFWTNVVSNIPDLLDYFVATITLSSWAGILETTFVQKIYLFRDM